MVEKQYRERLKKRNAQKGDENHRDHRLILARETPNSLLKI